MDSDDEIGIDSGNVSSDEDYDFMQVDEIQRSSGTGAQEPVDYPFEVLTTEEIVQHMLDCIAEVNNVVEVSSKSTLRDKFSSSKLDHRMIKKNFFFCCCYVNNIRVSLSRIIRQSNSSILAWRVQVKSVITNKIASEGGKKKAKQNRFRVRPRTYF